MRLFRYTWRTFSRELLLIATALAFCLPLYVLASLSLKTTAQTFTEPLAPPTDPEFSNYSVAWQEGGNAGLGQAFVNSVTITVGSVAFLILIGSLCGYTLARRKSRLSTGLYFCFVLGIILPFQLAIIPLYTALHKLDLAGTYVGMVLLYTGLLMPFTVFLYVGFIRVMPREYEEAAEVDGANVLRLYCRIVLPLLRPVSVTVAILSGLVIWNDFFLALIFLLGSTNETLPLALYSFAGEYGSRWNLIMAAVVVSVAPMLAFYLIAQRQLIRGFAGGIKG